MSIGDTFKKAWRKFVFLVVPAVFFMLYFDLMSHHNPFNVIYTGFGKYWFTITLFECFLVYYLSFIVFKNEKLRHFFLLMVSLAGIGLISINPGFSLAVIDMNHFAKYFHFFIWGILAMKYRTLYEKFMKSEIVKASAILAFFTFLFLLGYSIWPKVMFHFIRDIVLRYLGTFIVVSFFVCHASWFDKKNRLNTIILSIGQKSLAIYLLQYFFLPDIKFFSLIDNVDLLTIHIISILYTLVITILCLLFISILSNSYFIRKYCLGQK